MTRVLNLAPPVFNNGSLFIGIEGSNSDTSKTTVKNKSGRWSMVWRIDFHTGDSVPYQACQVYAARADNGAGTEYHDWGDIVISRSTLYDFNEANQGSFSGWLHYSLKTGLIMASYLNAAKPLSGQAGIIWNGQVYRFPQYSRFPFYYLYNGTIGTDSHISGNSATVDWLTAGAGDGSDAFKPPMDYGDAPATYDPSAGRSMT